MSKDVRPLEDPGVGLDCGTMNFVSARRAGKVVRTLRVRDAFVDLPLEHKRMLRLSQTDHMEVDGRLLVIGDEALHVANLLNREARRPMSGGLITPGEIDAQKVMAVMIRKLLGEPRVPSERCFFSVPAPAVDVQGSDVTYHSAIIRKILVELGFSAEPANEAMAVVFSECAPEAFSGLGISFGSGMTNVCLSYSAMSALEFSVARGGDWVDSSAARAVGTTAAKMCAMKEDGLDISSRPSTHEGEALYVFLTGLIDYAIENVIAQFTRARRDIMVPKPIPLVVSGGTSLAAGFLKRFEERFQVHRDKFPVQISEIRAARDPMTAVASGLLILSQDV